MNITVVIASHGDEWWGRLANQRAYPSAVASGADEILIRHERNQTRAQVRNALTIDAAGDYIVTLDADDELAPGYCDAIREMEPVDALVVPRVQYVRGHREGAPYFIPPVDIRQDNWMVVGTAFPRDRFLRVGGWRTLMGTGVLNEADDWDLWARLTNDGCGITYCEGAVYRAFVDRVSAHRSSGITQRRKWADEIRELNWPNEQRRQKMPVRYSEQSAGPSTRRAADIGVYEEAPPSGDTGDYGTLTKAELQAEAEARGLPTSGKKADLIARLSE